MTPLQLRIKYRIETGKYSTYGIDNNRCLTYKGGLVNDYATWVEENLISILSLFSVTDMHQKYQTETGNRAIDYKDRFSIRYKKPYKYWIEALLCEKLTELENELHK